MAISLLQKFSKALVIKSMHTTCRRAIALTSLNMEKALENLQNNPYYEKYSSRISELQKASPEKFEARLQQQNKGQEKNTKLAPVDTRYNTIAIQPSEYSEIVLFELGQQLFI